MARRQKMMTGFGELLGKPLKGRWKKTETPRQWNLNGWGDVGGSGTATALNRRSADANTAARRAARKRVNDSAAQREQEIVERFGEAARHAPPAVIAKPEVEPSKCGLCDRAFDPMGTADPLCWECRRSGVRREMYAAGVRAPKVTEKPVVVLRPTRGSRKTGRHARTSPSKVVREANACWLRAEARRLEVLGPDPKLEPLPRKAGPTPPTAKQIAATQKRAR